MISLPHYLRNFAALFPGQVNDDPWTFCANIQSLLSERLKSLSTDYVMKGHVAIHKNAQVEAHVVLKGPCIISDGCFIGAHAYLRGGVFLGEKVSVGPGCEIKSSCILPGSALAHFNFVGDSLLGSGVNMEAGSIICNHYNEREDKAIFVMAGDQKVATGVTKFGALVGDNVKIGANAVLSPGTILAQASVVKRLELVEQIR
jgi:bifunctional N-acetylglucosamine-1-phosphate-uridyltransferase/glucosamine-1-phosphate-acetyltransferase GlmU-like protein